MFVLALAVLALPAHAQTHRAQVSTIAPTPQNWFVRPDGGTRYSVNVPLGQCDGKADVSYASTGGTGVNQHCAFKDPRYMWDDKSGKVGSGAWVIAGGDTVIVRGGPWRIGWDGATGDTSGNWCYGVGSYTCYNPPMPAGTAAQHTRILGACAFGTYTCTPVDHYPLTSNNLTQLFGGFSLTWTINLTNTSYVDIEGIEMTTHNGACSHHGAPPYPKACSTDQPLDDYADAAFLTNNATSNITLQDVYIHGFESDGLNGPIGGPITMTRVFAGFNVFAGWNFDDGYDTPDAPGSSITASHVTMEGNGCKEQYPIINVAFPASACWDSSSGGFGDGWSGQDTVLDSFICDHCNLLYNSKDGYIGPHTQILRSQITNSFAYGNMGAAWKWGEAINGTILFQNNLTVANPWRMTEAIPGAAQNFNKSTGLPGSYLTNYNRGNAGIATITRIGSVNHYYGNTFIAAGAILFQYGCGFFTPGNHFNQENSCGSVPNVFENNNVFGYTDPATGSGSPSALYYVTDSPGIYTFTTASFNNEFGLKVGTTDTCGTNNNTCVDPLMVGEPSQTWVNEAALDVFNPSLAANAFYPSFGSPLRGAGTPISGLPTDFYGSPRPTPSGLGAVEFAGAIAPPPPPPPPALITPTITWPKPASIVFGAALSTAQLNATTPVPGTFTYTPAAGTIPAVGTDTLSATFTPTDTASYTNATATVQLVVTQPVVKLGSVTCSTGFTASIVSGKISVVCK
jgi:hypothetical protein